MEIIQSKLIGFVSIEKRSKPKYVSQLNRFHLLSLLCSFFLIRLLLPLTCFNLLCLKRNHLLFTNYIKLTVNIYGHIKIREFFSSIIFVCFHQLAIFITFYQCFQNMFCNYVSQFIH